jgi:hypothetical protein
MYNVNASVLICIYSCGWLWVLVYVLLDTADCRKPFLKSAVMSYFALSASYSHTDIHTYGYTDIQTGHTAKQILFLRRICWHYLYRATASKENSFYLSTKRNFCFCAGSANVSSIETQQAKRTRSILVPCLLIEISRDFFKKNLS